MAPDVFISYSSQDKPVADRVYAALKQAGLQCWKAPESLTAGRSYPSQIIAAIQRCRVMVFILSKNSNSSPQVLREVERAVHHDVMLVPFRIEPVTPTADLEYYLSVPHWLDAYEGPMETHLETLTDTIGQLLGQAADGDAAERAAAAKESAGEERAERQRQLDAATVAVQETSRLTETAPVTTSRTNAAHTNHRLGILAVAALAAVLLVAATMTIRALVSTSSGRNDAGTRVEGRSGKGDSIAASSGGKAAASASIGSEVELLKHAQKALQDGDTTAARDAFTKVLQTNPRQRNALSGGTYLALWSAQKKQRTKDPGAADDYRQALLYGRTLSQLEPNYFEAWSWLTFAYFGLSHLEFGHDNTLSRVWADSGTAMSNRMPSLQVMVSRVQMNNGSAKVEGTIWNRSTIAKGFTIFVDFLDNAGGVVCSARQLAVRVQAEGREEFSVKCETPNATAFRYRVAETATPKRP